MADFTTEKKPMRYTLHVPSQRSLICIVPKKQKLKSIPSGSVYGSLQLLLFQHMDTYRRPITDPTQMFEQKRSKTFDFRLIITNLYSILLN